MADPSNRDWLSPAKKGWLKISQMISGVVVSILFV